MKNATAAYQKAQVMTSDPLRLVLLLYDEGIRYLKEAIEAYQEKDYERKSERIIYGMEVISELLASLDLEKGGDIARRLQAIYTFLLQEILLADAEERTDRLETVVGMLEELRDAWRQLEKR